ncbi:MAG: hypothetical protein KGL39_13840 [Patescibacteria group bacterium]|nr:hypothetical protein [Patescibacteria group bacterium]
MMGAPFDPYQYAESASPGIQPQVMPPSKTFDPYAYATSINSGEITTNYTKNTALPKSISGMDIPIGFTLGTLQPIAGSIAGGLAGTGDALWGLASGKGWSQSMSNASDVVGNVENAMSPKAITQDEQIGLNAAKSKWDPLNLIGEGLTWASNKAGDMATKLGASPLVATGAYMGPQIAASVLGGAVGKLGEGGEAADAIEDLSSKSRGIPQTAEEAQQSEREAILSRVGIRVNRNSALEGNSKDASTDYQMTKFDTPGGNRMSEQFAHENQALQDHAASIVKETGGTLGMDEDAMANKGEILDKPFSLARDWFKKNTNDLYAKVFQNTQGQPFQMNNFMKELANDEHMTNQDRFAFRNSVRAFLKNKSMLSGSEDAPIVSGSVADAERVVQHLNSNWSPQVSSYIKALKNASDTDVANAGGLDAVQQARAMHALKARTLDDPNGISQLFDVDPSTPINRTTPFERIPQRLMTLSADQFANVIKALKNLPPEIQEASQNALGELRGHMANKLLQAGNETRAGVARTMWNADAVSNVLKNNAAKYRIAFEDDPVSLQKIEDLNKAGQILKVNPAYPGSYAQTVNAARRGVVARFLPTAARMGGAMAGGATGIPLAAGAGEFLGDVLGKKLSTAAMDRVSLADAEARLKKSAIH